MKAKRISNPFRKGNQAARKMQVRFFLSLMVLLVTWTMYPTVRRTARI